MRLVILAVIFLFSATSVSAQDLESRIAARLTSLEKRIEAIEAAQNIVKDDDKCKCPESKPCKCAPGTCVCMVAPVPKAVETLTTTSGHQIKKHTDGTYRYVGIPPVSTIQPAFQYAPQYFGAVQGGCANGRCGR